MARPPTLSAPRRLVRVDERRRHIHVTGEGTPTVVFESGMGASCLSWTLVQPHVAQFARAGSYDRAGHGWSDPAREPRTARQIAQELHTLLDYIWSGVASLNFYDGKQPKFAFAFQSHIHQPLERNVTAADSPVIRKS